MPPFFKPITRKVLTNDATLSFPNPISPPPSLALQQPTEKSAVTPSFSGVDTFEKEEASGVKARSGAKFQISLADKLSKDQIKLVESMLKATFKKVTQERESFTSEMFPEDFRFHFLIPELIVEIKQKTKAKKLSIETYYAMNMHGTTFPIEEGRRRLIATANSLYEVDAFQALEKHFPNQKIEIVQSDRPLKDLVDTE